VHTTRVRTSLDARALMEHYARQLVDSGWTRDTTSYDRELAQRFLMVPTPGDGSSESRPRQATLRITTPLAAPQCRFVRLETEMILGR
jgi:hypothetical protein